MVNPERAMERAPRKLSLPSAALRGRWDAAYMGKCHCESGARRRLYWPRRVRRAQVPERRETQVSLRSCSEL